MRMINYSKHLLKNIHKKVPLPEDGEVFYCKGEYEYWHYGCDGINDQGWGCGYRTLQTISSWIINNLNIEKPVPSIKEIQEVLVSLEDKESNFVGSKEWIGSFEVCIVLDTLYNIPSKIVHISELENFIDNKNVFINHFKNNGSPLMMGGDKDCSSKGIVGVHFSQKYMYILIVDPHFVGKATNAEQLMENGFLYWRKIDDLSKDSFYNICFPQVKYVER